MRAVADDHACLPAADGAEGAQRLFLSVHLRQAHRGAAGSQLAEAVGGGGPAVPEYEDLLGVQPCGD